MHKKWIQFFSITFFVLASLIFFVPDKALARVCLYFPSEAARQQSIQQFGFPKFTCIEGDAAVQNCMNICNSGAVSCSNMSDFDTCAQYEADSQRQQQQAKRDDVRYENESLQRLLSNDPTFIDNANTQGQCLCSVGDASAPLTELAGLSIDQCYDRNDNAEFLDYQDNRDDSANGKLFNCRWEYNNNIDDTLQNNANTLEQDDSYKPLQQYQSVTRDLNKLRATSIQGFLGIAIRMATGILGTIALSMMVYGGFLWLTSAGNASQVEKARNVILYGALGIFVIFGSYALVNFVFEAINPIKTL